MTKHPDKPIDPMNCVRRAYRISAVGRDGHVASSVEIEAANDQEAIRLSRPLGAFYAVELWDGPMFLARFGPGETVSWGQTQATDARGSRPRPGHGVQVFG